MDIFPEQPQALLDGPAGPPPNGKVSHFDDPPNLRRTGRAILLVFWALPSVLLILRMYTKVFITRLVRISDYAMIIAWILFIGCMATLWLVNNLSGGTDQWNMRMRDFLTMLYYFHASAIIYGICIFFIKLSILLQFLEISCTGSEIISSGPATASYGSTLASMPSALSWSSSLFAVSRTHWMLFSRRTRIWRLQLALCTKIAISAVFAVGLSATASAIMRLRPSVASFTTTNNVSLVGYMTGVWTIPEICFGIIAGCLPSTTKFFRTCLAGDRISKWGLSIKSLVSDSSCAESPDGDYLHSVGAHKFLAEPDPYPLSSFATVSGSTRSTSSFADRLGSYAVR
ncbi:hypothetical protein BJX99DRAFT_257914 [Aspergillus californicus]